VRELLICGCVAVAYATVNNVLAWTAYIRRLGGVSWR
jgi:hypothetical protein